MPSHFQRVLAVLVVLILSLPAGSLPASATCGGGGGGGMGGSNPGGGGGRGVEPYHVPWKVISPGETVPDGALVVYWFPTSRENAQGSDLLTSRFLTLSSAQCVSMAVVTNDNAPLRSKYASSTKDPVAVLSAKDGAEIGRVVGEKGKLRADDVEELLRNEMNRREDEAKQALDAAKQKASAKDTEGAAALYTQVWEQHCLLPSPAKKAAKALKKLGKPVPEAESSQLDAGEPDFSEPRNTEIIRTMRAGLAAERDGKILDAQRLYAAAQRLDAADPVPARFLGELLRHETGDWDGARAMFSKLLAMRADPISRAVALHGLGKMTIHDGDFEKGLALFEESLRVYPLPVTYRNLAVYWNSEKQAGKAYEYVTKALDLDPDDEYNQIFAATYLADMGRAREAEEIARRHEQVLAASYNLAVIHAQLGDKQKALELLSRHFFVYEQFEAVRAKEMQEARDDIAFARYHKDPDFVKLTAMADTDASSYHRKRI